MTQPKYLTTQIKAISSQLAAQHSCVVPSNGTLDDSEMAYFGFTHHGNLVYSCECFKCHRTHAQEISERVQFDMCARPGVVMRLRVCCQCSLIPESYSWVTTRKCPNEGCENKVQTTTRGEEPTHKCSYCEYSAILGTR